MSDQLRHDEINLRKLLQNIKSSVEKDELRRCSVLNDHEWLNVLALQTGIKHCRTLFEKLKSHGYVPKELSMHEAQGIYDNIKKDIDDLEVVLAAARNQRKLESFIKLPILPSLSQLRSSSKEVTTDGNDRGSSSPLEKTKELGLPSSAGADSDTYSSFEDTEPLLALTKSPETLLVPNDSVSNSTQKSFIDEGHPQASSALQDELAEQLAQMARQLRNNAMLFNDALAKDHNVIVEAQQKIEENYDSVTKERTRVRDLGRKSSGSTCLVILSVLIVVIAFIFTFFAIRLT